MPPKHVWFRQLFATKSHCTALNVTKCNRAQLVASQTSLCPVLVLLFPLEFDTVGFFEGLAKRNFGIGDLEVDIGAIFADRT